MKSRTESLEIAQSKKFDLIIIGGGITGAGIAQNAALHGLSTLLIDQNDFASGTSSRTTKLIHGGLRYLEQFEFKLTTELCQERALLSQIAPHLVKEIDFILPLEKENHFFNLKARLGLSVYDLLSLASSAPHHHKVINANETFQIAPAITSNNINGAISFIDCQTDDSRIVLAVIQSACENGAIAINYMKAISMLRESDKVKGVVCHDYLTGDDYSFHGEVCINATGVWSDDICRLVIPKWQKRITASKGIHILVSPSAFNTTTGLFLPTEDNRWVFVIPWHQYVMIGTTDSPYTGDLMKPIAQDNEIDYLLSVVNKYAENRPLTRTDITATFAGLRPLVNFSAHNSNSNHNNTSSMSREHIIFEAPGELICVAGGKLTSYRLMAEEIMEKTFQKLPHKTMKADITKEIMLGGFTNKEDFITKCNIIRTKALKIDLEPRTIDHLIANYGSDAQLVIEIAETNPLLKEKICADFPFIMAEIPFSVTREMTISLQDLLFRRLRLGMLHFKQCLEAAPKIAYLMQPLLNWDENRVQAEINSLNEYISELMEPFTK
jgi:glycerol-3-phosphate dehydrogenase